jgi:hypothetical protein
MKNLSASNTQESQKDLAQTPAWFVDSASDLLGINQFELDVCALDATSKAGYCFSLSERNEDALALDWDLWNWCNPPFSNVQSFVEKAISQSTTGYRNTAMLMPNNPETVYCRHAKQWADTIIEMPFRLKFLKPDGSKFLDSKGKEQTPQFSCLLAVFTPLGLVTPTRTIYHDFRIGFYDKKIKVAA